jgi:hypothetical protein
VSPSSHEAHKEYTKATKELFENEGTLEEGYSDIFNFKDPHGFS